MRPLILADGEKRMYLQATADIEPQTEVRYSYDDPIYCKRWRVLKKYMKPARIERTGEVQVNIDGVWKEIDSVDENGNDVGVVGEADVIDEEDNKPAQLRKFCHATNPCLFVFEKKKLKKF